LHQHIDVISILQKNGYRGERAAIQSSSDDICLPAGTAFIGLHPTYVL
jgi:hypothetical protein